MLTASKKRLSVAALLASLWLVLTTPLVTAGVTSELGTLSGAGWQADQVKLELELIATPEVSLSISRLRIDNLDFPLRNLHLRCHHLESGAGRLWCRSLSAKAALGPVDAAQIIDLSLEFEFDWGRSELLAWSVSIVDATVSTGLLQQFLSSTLAP